MRHQILARGVTLRSTRPSPRYDAPRLARDMPATTPAAGTLAQAWAALRSFVRGL